MGRARNRRKKVNLCKVFWQLGRGESGRFFSCYALLRRYLFNYSLKLNTICLSHSASSRRKQDSLIAVFRKCVSAESWAGKEEEAVYGGDECVYMLGTRACTVPVEGLYRTCSALKPYLIFVSWFLFSIAFPCHLHSLNHPPASEFSYASVYSSIALSFPAVRRLRAYNANTVQRFSPFTPLSIGDFLPSNHTSRPVSSPPDENLRSTLISIYERI